MLYGCRSFCTCQEFVISLSIDFFFFCQTLIPEVATGELVTGSGTFLHSCCSILRLKCLVVTICFHIHFSLIFSFISPFD